MNYDNPYEGGHRFLTGISYFGANKWDHDPSGVFEQLCNLGINAVRIFPDFWIGDGGGQCSPSAFLPPEHAVIDVNGNLQLTNLNRLMNVLDKARAYGLVVDLSFAYEVVQGRTFQAHALGIQRLADWLGWVGYQGRFDHVFFDVQNEHDSVGCPTRKNWANVDNTGLNLITPTMAAARLPISRTVTASINGTAYGNLLAVVDGGSLLFALHEPRDLAAGFGDWWQTGLWDFLMNNMSTLWSMRPSISGQKPLIYAQEPCAAKACQGISSKNLFDSLRHAFRKGLAGWVFHTEALFYPPPGRSLGSEWLPAELEFLGVSPSAGGWTLRNAIQSECWGSSGTWIEPCVMP